MYCKCVVLWLLTIVFLYSIFTIETVFYFTFITSYLVLPTSTLGETETNIHLRCQLSILYKKWAALSVTVHVK